MFNKVARYFAGALFFFIVLGAAHADDSLFGERRHGGLKIAVPSLWWTESGSHSYLRFGITDHSGIKVWKNNFHSGHMLAGSYVDIGRCQWAVGFSRDERTNRIGTISDCRLDGHRIFFGAESDKLGHWVQASYRYRFGNGVETGIVWTRAREMRYADMVLSWEHRKSGWNLEAMSAIENGGLGTIRVQARKVF